MQTIHDYWLKIKGYAEAGAGEYGLAALVVLIAFACFGLGRLSVLVEKTPVLVSQTAALGQAINPGGQYEASRNGTVYYFPWCAGAQSIQPEDQVWFTSEDAAQKAGYTAAKNCKGLTDSQQ